MKTVLFAFLMLTVTVLCYLSTQSRGHQPSHKVDDGPPAPSVAEFEAKRPSTYIDFFKHYQPAVIFLVFLIGLLYVGKLFAINLAFLLKRHKAGLLPSSYYTMISRPNKDAGQPDDDEGANKNEQHPIRTTGKYDEGECAICYASPQVDKSFPPCGHTYCFDCLVRCCNIQKVCPTCQRKISFFNHGDGKLRCEWNQLKWKLVFITLVVMVSFDMIDGLIDLIILIISVLLSAIIVYCLVLKLTNLGLLTDDTLDGDLFLGHMMVH